MGQDHDISGVSEQLAYEGARGIKVRKTLVSLQLTEEPNPSGVVVRPECNGERRMAWGGSKENPILVYHRSKSPAPLLRLLVSACNTTDTAI